MKARGTRTSRILTALIVVAVATLALGAADAGAAGKARPRSYTPYFGELHAHTALSDGTGTPENAYAGARAAGMDFFAVTDHNQMITPQDWPAIQAAADAATSPTFVGVAAYELGWYYDHLNVFDTTEWLRQTDTSQAHNALPSTFYDAVLTCPGALGMFNHPTWSAGDDFDDFAYRTPERDAALALLEIFNWESTVYDGDPPYEASYVKCLDAGWHVMPAATSDSHYTDYIVDIPYEARTALLATSLTRESLYAAMRARRGYATQDKNLRVSFTVNGAVMGARLAPTSRYTVAVTVSDPDTLVVGDVVKKLEIVSDGGAVAASRRVGAAAVSWSTTVGSTTAHWMYLRVTTADGQLAWTAPVWTGR